jgi:hypothetical protein
MNQYEGMGSNMYMPFLLILCMIAAQIRVLRVPAAPELRVTRQYLEFLMRRCKISH